MSEEKPSYMKAVEANCQMCKHWQSGNHCAFVGKLKIRNGVCFGMEPIESFSVNRLTRKGKRFLP